MDKFEKFIQNNREEFDSQTPSNDLWAKIAAETTSPNRRRIIPFYSRIAAILILALGSWIGIRLLVVDHSSTGSSLGLSPEIAEATVYYESVIHEKKELLFQLTAGQTEVQQGINEDMAMLDSAMIEIKKDLDDQVANQEVVEALIQNYRMKLQILEEILSYIEDNNKQTNDNENAYEL